MLCGTRLSLETVSMNHPRGRRTPSIKSAIREIALVRSQLNVVPHGYSMYQYSCPDTKSAKILCPKMFGGKIFTTKIDTHGRVYIIKSHARGLAPGAKEKVDRRPNPTRHLAGQHAEQTARVAYGLVSPTWGVDELGESPTAVALRFSPAMATLGKAREIGLVGLRRWARARNTVVEVRKGVESVLQ